MKTGSLVFMKIATKLAIGETSSSFSSDSTAIDVSNKLSGRDTNVEYGRMNRTFTVANIGDITPNATYWNLEDAVTAMKNGTKVAVTVTSYTTKAGSTAVVGDVKLSATCVITNVSLEAGDNSAQTFSVTLQVDGALSVTLN
jgi:hypothetical protein